MDYNEFRYIFPPRPKNAIPPSDIDFWDNKRMLAQPKLNGSNCTVFTDGNEIHVMNRHFQRMTNVEINKEELVAALNLTVGKWNVINGEYMNKSKSDENNKVFNHKFVIFDLLVSDSVYLIGKTFAERVELMDEKFGTQECEKDYLYKNSDNIYRVKTYTEDFYTKFIELIKIDMIEGFVFKRKNAPLEAGWNEMNNVKSQIKARKPTRNYKF
jgi:ATP-dependent DNA ligase